MSTVFIHIGQCGNQLSLPMWQNFNLHKDDKSTNQVFSALDGFHRCVHIDSEQKVVKSLPKTFKIRDKNIIIGKRGRGNNFALGYNGLHSSGDDQLLESGLDSIRKEVERCDVYTGSIVVHSLSGGTGSGLGSHLIENIRDEYPSKNILSCCVSPCASGESPLQSLNALLTIHWLQNYCDSIAFLQNDALVKYASKVKKDGTVPSVSFNDINKHAANLLNGIFLPTDTLTTSKGTSLGQEPWELVRSLTPMPSLKFFVNAHSASSKMSWDALTSKALLQCPKYNDSGIQNKSLSAVVVARGDSQNTFMYSVKEGLDKKLKRGLNFVNWNPYPLDCWTNKTSLTGIRDSSSITVALNNSSIIEPLNLILSRSLAKLNIGAYTHWYYRHGICKVRR